MNEIVSITSLDKAKALVAQANTAQLKEIISQAEAMRVYAQQAKRGLEIQNQCAEIKLRAEKRLGEQLATMPKQSGSRGAGKKVESQDTTPLLEDLGIDKHQSSRYQAVASLPDKEFEKHIAEVKQSNEELTTVGVIRLARQLQAKNKPHETPELPNGKFSTIYADPSWEYQRTSGQGMAADQYPTMPLEEIKALPVAELADDDCLLFLWVTGPMLREGLEVIEAWGFEYKTFGFTWFKTNKRDGKPFFGIGTYAKSNAELCLLATKGQAAELVKDDTISQVVIAPRREHSRKPDEVRRLIEKLVGTGPKVELFSRQEAPGWTSWGSEVGKYK